MLRLRLRTTWAAAGLILLGTGCAGPAYRMGHNGGPMLRRPADPIARLDPAPISFGPSSAVAASSTGPGPSEVAPRSPARPPAPSSPTGNGNGDGTGAVVNGETSVGEARPVDPFGSLDVIPEVASNESSGPRPTAIPDRPMAPETSTEAGPLPTLAASLALETYPGPAPTSRASRTSNADPIVRTDPETRRTASGFRFRRSDLAADAAMIEPDRTRSEARMDPVPAPSPDDDSSVMDPATDSRASERTATAPRPQGRLLNHVRRLRHLFRRNRDNHQTSESDSSETRAPAQSKPHAGEEPLDGFFPDFL